MSIAKRAAKRPAAKKAAAKKPAAKKAAAKKPAAKKAAGGSRQDAYRGWVPPVPPPPVESAAPAKKIGKRKP